MRRRFQEKNIAKMKPVNSSSRNKGRDDADDELILPEPDVVVRHRHTVHLTINHNAALTGNGPEYALEDGRTGQRLMLNDSAACVWRLCQQGLDARKIDEVLSAHLPERRGPSRNVETVLADFTRAGLAAPDMNGQQLRGVTYDTDYQPVKGKRSNKAERLVRYCMGDYADRPVPPDRSFCGHATRYYAVWPPVRPRRAWTPAGQ